MLEVGAHTRVRDVCENIAARQQLASWVGCSLFIKISDKVQPAGGLEGGGQAGCGPPDVLAAGTKVVASQSLQVPSAQGLVWPLASRAQLPAPHAPWEPLPLSRLPLPGHHPEGGRLLLRLPAAGVGLGEEEQAPERRWAGSWHREGGGGSPGMEGRRRGPTASLGHVRRGLLPAPPARPTHSAPCDPLGPGCEGPGCSPSWGRG